MNIELMIDRKKKTFQMPAFIPGRMIRRAVTLKQINFGTLEEAQIDELVQYVVNVYGDQFNIDEFYDGVDARKMMDVIVETIYFVVNGTIDAIGASNDPNK